MEVTDVNDLEGVERAIAFAEPSCGLRGFLVLDDLTLGPAAGGVRTRAYAREADALTDAARLARAMTLKCALAGLDAGGGKCVVLDHPDLDRPRAFAALGELVESLAGAFHTAGDLGTTLADLQAMASSTAYVHTDADDLTAAVARGLIRCLQACTSRLDRELAGLRVAVQGCGAIGAAVARGLAAVGARLMLADVELARVTALACELGAEIAEPRAILLADVDVVAPCAVGGAIDAKLARALRAWAVCGAANNILSEPVVGRQLAARDILFVPDVVASAGAVIHGIGRTVMALEDTAPLIDFLGATTTAIFDDAARTGRTPSEAAEALARFRIGMARHRRAD
jgi:leucine dehydrogenase